MNQKSNCCIVTYLVHIIREKNNPELRMLPQLHVRAARATKDTSFPEAAPSREIKQRGRASRAVLGESEVRDHHLSYAAQAFKRFQTRNRYVF